MAELPETRYRPVPPNVGQDALHHWATWAMAAPPNTLPPGGVRHGLRQPGFKELVSAHPSPTAVSVAIAHHPAPPPKPRTLTLGSGAMRQPEENAIIVTDGPLGRGSVVIIDGVEHTIVS